MKKKISITVNEKVLRDIDALVDNIGIKNRSQAIEHVLQSSLGEKKVAVILAGGHERKLKVGKEHLPVVQLKNSSLVEEAVKKLRKDGFKEIFVIGRHIIITKVFEHLKEGSSLGVKINYVEEKSSEGTAESLRHLKGLVQKSFLVVYADLLFNKVNISELWSTHVKGDSIATLMLTTHARPKEKGVVKMEGSKVVDFQQKPAKSFDHLVFSPIFAAEPELLSYSGKSLESNVFPLLARKGLLRGHLSSEKEHHVHTVKDIKSARNLIK